MRWAFLWHSGYCRAGPRHHDSSPTQAGRGRPGCARSAHRFDPAEVAGETDVIITVLPADAELEEIVFGENGLMKSFGPDKILIDMTTCTAGTLARVRAAVEAAGGQVLDAQVSGGTAGASAGTLTIMAGGDAALLETCRPLLNAMASRIFHVGGVGQGKVVKIINQALAAIHLLAIGEAFALGVRCGADVDTMYEVIKESSGYSRMMDLRLPGFLASGIFLPGFKLDLMKKDVLLAQESASESRTPALFISTAAQIFAAASSAGKGEDDFSAAAEYLASLAQTSLQRVPAQGGDQ